MIGKGKIVSLNYVLRDDKGEELDRSESGQPFSYLHGEGQIVKGLENAMNDLKTGDKKKVVVSPKEGYGDVNPSLKLTVKRDAFPADVEIEPGMQFEAQSPNDGHPVVFTVESVVGDEVKIDGNHPLAGQTLHFEVEVAGVRDATAEEKQHGHAHGEGSGHDH